MSELTDTQQEVLATIGATPQFCTLADLVESWPDSGPDSLHSDALALRDLGFVVPVQAWKVTAAGRTRLAGRHLAADLQILPSSQDLLAAADGEIPPDDPFAGVLTTMFMACTVRQWFDPDRIITNAGSVGSDLLQRIGIDARQLQDAMAARLMRHVQAEVPHIAGYGCAVGGIVSAWPTGHRQRAPGAHRKALADACLRYDALTR
ncbi:hypothetical protein [Nocardia sp. alder85J]|uniref:hypothetical protein n=1 Tax=Nocardia sp. alder85J TaxID=2862949 RepID=UPI001CD665CB|nr:hypothetical protein [Nocardia sp. alder85J]MCX4094579.1 hypothetical protein [Nocardia sp. alder85J]